MYRWDKLEERIISESGVSDARFILFDIHCTKSSWAAQLQTITKETYNRVRTCNARDSILPQGSLFFSVSAGEFSKGYIYMVVVICFMSLLFDDYELYRFGKCVSSSV